MLAYLRLVRAKGTGIDLIRAGRTIVTRRTGYRVHCSVYLVAVEAIGAYRAVTPVKLVVVIAPRTRRVRVASLRTVVPLRTVVGVNGSIDMVTQITLRA